MATPREEVLLSQQMSNGLKPDRTTSQPKPAAAAPTAPAKANSVNAYPRMKAAVGQALSDAPGKIAGMAARNMPGVTAGVGMANYAATPMNYKSTAANPAASESMGTTINGNFVSNAQAQRSALVPSQSAAGPRTRQAAATPVPGTGVLSPPAVAQQAPGMFPAPNYATPQAQVPPRPPVMQPVAAAATAQPQAPQLQPGDMNTYQRGNGQVVAVQPATPGGVAAPVQAAPAYDMPQAYSGPVPQRPSSANIAGGMTREEIIKRMEGVTGDSAFKGSPIARKAMLDALGGMLGDYDKAEISRESNAQDVQKTAVAGQAAGANEMQRGQQRRAENIFAQQGAETLKAMDQNTPSEITDEAGNTFLRRGAKAEAVLGPDGKQIKQGARAAANSNPRLDALIKLQEIEAKGRLPGEAAPANDPVAAAIKQELGLGGEQAQDIPAGYTLAGTSKDGKRVFKDANGNLFSE